MMELKGAYDLHVHTSPDVIKRKLTDMELAAQAREAGMAGIAIKSHIFPTAGRAALIQALFPELDVVGGIALNEQVGGINPAAVLAAAKMGCRIVWFPTMDAKAYRLERGLSGGYSILDEAGGITPETLRVLEIAKEYDLVVGTGHIGRAEAYRLVKIAHEVGVKRICLTHVTLPVCKMEIPELKQCIEWGAVLEYSYTHIVSGKCSPGYIAEQIRAVGYQNVMLDTDLGQAGNPYPVDGLRDFLNLLSAEGIAEEELSYMIRETPVRLVGRQVKGC